MLLRPMGRDQMWMLPPTLDELLPVSRRASTWRPRPRPPASRPRPWTVARRPGPQPAGRAAEAGRLCPTPDGSGRALAGASARPGAPASSWRARSRSGTSTAITRASLAASSGSPLSAEAIAARADSHAARSCGAVAQRSRAARSAGRSAGTGGGMGRSAVSCTPSRVGGSAPSSRWLNWDSWPPLCRAVDPRGLPRGCFHSNFAQITDARRRASHVGRPSRSRSPA